MRVLAKVGAVVLGTAMVTGLTIGQAAASTNTAAVTTATASAATPDSVPGATWFRSVFQFGDGNASEAACIIEGAALVIQNPEHIDGTKCLLEDAPGGGALIRLWLHGDAFAKQVFGFPGG